MKKETKIILYCVLGIILITVIWLMLWWPKQDAWEPDVIPNITPESVWQEIWNTEDQNNDIQPQNSNDSEKEILNDLENLFRSNNGYENVEWEFWFTSSES